VTQVVSLPDVAHVSAMLARRAAVNEAFFMENAAQVARLCAAMADRFVAGGRLVALGWSPAARSDVRHVAVEFVHPVIVGKRALPAIGLSQSAGGARSLESLIAPDDVVLAFGDAGGATGHAVVAAVESARRCGALTVAFDSLGAEVELKPSSDDAFVRQECVETLYHVLWELVHVFFEHGIVGRGSIAHPGQSAFLYPFLTDAPRDRAPVIDDVARSALTKARDVNTLRARTLDESASLELMAAAAAMRDRLEAGGAVLTVGNGGSATDAMDLAADLLEPPVSLGLVPRRALDLTDDAAILTALANDVGPDVVFARQVAVYASPRDVVVAFTTSGNSRNIIAALDAARRRGLLTIAFTGYDGGRIGAEQLADHIINAPSEYVPRIQEAHATAYHALRTLLG
jgi:D-sedoheptulose 7-phosphate isomerase